MTIELKSCWGWVVAIIVVQLVLLVLFVGFEDKLSGYNEMEKSTIIQPCEWSGDTMMNKYCSVGSIITQLQHGELALLGLHMMLNLFTFLWINSRQQWVRWISCDMK